MAQQNQTPNQTTQIIAKSPWYEIYRELGEDTFRIIVRYVDYYDAGVNAMRILEMRGDVVRLYVKWNTPERRGEIIKTVRLQPDDAARWRSQIMRIASIKDFERLIWELDEAVITHKE